MTNGNALPYGFGDYYSGSIPELGHLSVNGESVGGLILRPAKEPLIPPVVSRGSRFLGSTSGKAEMKMGWGQCAHPE